jgi:hypothetical protein
LNENPGPLILEFVNGLDLGDVPVTLRSFCNPVPLRTYGDRKNIVKIAISCMLMLAATVQASEKTFSKDAVRR